MTQLSPQEYAKVLRNFLKSHGNPENVKPMEAYMKNQFKFFGIKTPNRRALVKGFFKEIGMPSIEQLEKYIPILWQQPEREVQFTAQEIVGKYMKIATPDKIELYEYMIVNKSWWDTVDYIAIWLVGTLFKNYPEMIDGHVERWMASGNLWLQRTAILFQNNYKEQTNEDLLFSLCERLGSEKEFFIRKAIGWALREYAYTNPQAVLEFVNSHELSPLSKREAIKRIQTKT